ncbi:PEPxxWA-CTERM sorting domain-containing protein [Sphingomonas sp. AP4-R1]|uniref:PEPxxWA-CTERM sorting domain-containing protein n=1 Tax=Sphingomonas sp. AP4-R1 TaxID=2735134 RepID=UPI0020A50231|nr:PEPxxWA-CTERM sorting domain-containing protein [Sphingomonas sp. AP4-R1]
MSRFVSTAALAALAAACATPAAATISIFSSKADFVAANAPLAEETFDGVTVNRQIGQVPFDVGGFTLRVGANNAIPTTIGRALPGGGPYNFDQTDPYLFANLGRNETLIFTFDTPIFAFGADFDGLNNQFDGGSRTSFFVGTTQVALPIAAEDGLISFFGVQSTEAFTSVTFRGIVPANSSTYESVGIDNVLFGGAPAAVPEPASWAMFIGGFGLIGGALRRRRPVGEALA